jgi:hypothetical protein
VAWPSEYARLNGWLNPWPGKVLTPVPKWLPLYAPLDDWERTTLDSSGNRIAPLPPEGIPVYWWKLPREYWPYKNEMPWEDKIFGAWPASQVLMPEDLPPSIWPGGNRAPKFGFIKLKMDGELDGVYSGHQIAFMDMHIHMRWISPDEMKVKTAITPMGPRYYFQAPGWEQHITDYKEFQIALRARRRGRIQQMLAREIARSGGRPKPSRDLFS